MRLCMLRIRTTGCAFQLRACGTAPNAHARRWRGFGPVVCAIGVFGAAFAWRALRHKLLGHNSSSAVHKDTSIATITEGAATVDIRGRESKPASSDIEARSALVRNAEANALSARRRVEAEAAETLHRNLSSAFATIRDRGAERFADWYFAYPTSYRLMSIATRSTASHVVDVGSQQRLGECVAEELELYLLDQYQKIVLRPEINDTHLRSAYQRAVQAAHDKYIHEIKDLLDGSFAQLLGQASACARFDAPRADVTYDWQSQVYKARHVQAAYEKVPELSLAFVIAGASAGKAAGAKFAASVGAKAVAALGTKLVAPFSAKVGAVAAPVGVGAAVGGPAGAVVGAAAGIAVDYAVNAGVALVQREQFLADVREVVDATANEWEVALQKELLRAIDMWFTTSLEGVWTEIHESVDRANPRLGVASGAQ